jgi:hypothetical protein
MKVRIVMLILAAFSTALVIFSIYQLLCERRAWGQTTTLEMPNYKYASDYIVKSPIVTPIIKPKIEDPIRRVLEYQGDGTYKWVDFPEHDGADLILRIGPYSYRNICIEKEGDKRRCVNLRWLYMLMVAAGIEEEK